MTSIFRIIRILPAILAAVWLSGCTNSDDLVDKPVETKSIQFSLTVPDVEIPSVSTRTMAGSNYKEDEIQRVDILVFDATNSPSETFLEWVQVPTSAISQNLTGNSSTSTATFSAPLSSTLPAVTSVRLVLVANRDLSVGNIASSFVKGTTTKAEAMEKLQHSLTTQWPADGGGTYTPIPMYGETTVITGGIHPGTTSVPAVSLTRMLARIDITTNLTSNFTVETVYLANANTTGYIAPPFNATTGQLTGSSDPNIPIANGKQTGILSPGYTVVNGIAGISYLGEIYTFEAAAAADGSGDNATSRKDAVCLIVKGRMAGETSSTYYRVDFMNFNSTTNANDYVPLKRNYKYTINIEEASGVGYATAQEALASYHVMTNLKVRLIAVDRYRLTNVVYNGQYMLGVSESEITTRQYQLSNYVVDVVTDEPGGWTATIVSDGSWLKFNNGTGGSYKTTGVVNDLTNYQDYGNFSLNIPYFYGSTGAEREATITVTAGRLTQTITVKQTIEEPGVIKFMDAYGNVLTNGLFFAMSDPDTGGDPAPQTFYVMWTSAQVETFRMNTSRFIELNDDNILYNSITPNIKEDGDLPSLRLENGVQAVTLNVKKGTDRTSVKGGDLLWAYDVLGFNLYDENSVYIGNQSFAINQGLLAFQINNYPQGSTANSYVLNLGENHTLDLESNNNWVITNVQEIGNTGLWVENIGDYNGVWKNQSNANMGRDPYKDGNNDWIYQKDVIRQGPTFNLSFKTGEWVPGKTGTVRITFANTMHTVDALTINQATGERTVTGDKYYPFYRTIDLQLVAGGRDYYTTNVTDPLFYVNPTQNVWYDNGVPKLGHITLAQAQADCANRGDGWRIPTLSEMMLSAVYADALGGVTNTPEGWYIGATGNTGAEYKYWTSTTVSSGGNAGKYALFQIPNMAKGLMDYAYASDGPWVAGVRCVHDGYAGSTNKYPRVEPYNQNGNVGTLIVSRDANGGVQNKSTIFFQSGETPNETAAMNKVASQLLVYNQDIEQGNPGDYEAAKTTCANLGTGGWRLPTYQESLLMMGVGMLAPGDTYANTGFTDYFTLPDSFTKISLAANPIWVLTQTSYDATKVYRWGDNYSFEDRGKTEGWWALARCVKTIN